MNNYEHYLCMIELCKTMASCFTGPMYQFYLNAAEGFRIKLNKLTIEEAGSYGK